MKTYSGYRVMRLGLRGEPVPAECRVVVNEDGTDRPLLPRYDLRNHSPTGFEWGYGGSGPAQLALALAADATGDDARARAVYQRLKWALVSHLPKDGWTLLAEDLLMVIRNFEDVAQLGALDDVGEPE